jgi:SAM-dependent methyltransferase
MGRQWHARVVGIRRVAALLLVLLVAACQGSTTGTSGGSHFPRPDRPVARIVSPSYSSEAERDAAGEAERVMDRLGIAPGGRVADIGAGDGYYTVRLARRLRPGATLYATDVEATYLDGLRARLAREGVTGVTVLQGRPRDPKLPSGSIDVAILSHMYHEIENPYEFLYRLQPSLAPGARVGVIDMDRPTPDHGTPPGLLRCELAAVGYRQLDFVWLAPADGYLAIFTPPETLSPAGAIRPCRQ